MKNIIYIFLIILIITAIQLEAQTSFSFGATKRNDGLVLFKSRLVVDSVGSYKSQILDLSAYDNESFVNYPIAYYYDIDKVNATDSINVSVQYWISYDGSNFIVADTLFTTAVAPGTSNPSAAIGTTTFNNVKAPYSQIRIYNNGISKKHYLTLGLYFYR